MKWYGEIGFKEEVEGEPGYWVPEIVPHNFYGDVLSPSWREQQGNKINADMQVSNKLSVVADEYLQCNFHKIAYVTFGGAKWTVSNFDLEERRIIMSLGSLFVEEVEE